MGSDSPQVQELKKRYRASFPEKLTVIQNIRMSLEVDNDTTLARDELHKLAGSSGMYGYQEIASNCREAMTHIDNDSVDMLMISLDQVIQLLSD